MGRTVWGARSCAAVVLMASCLTVTASAQQASVPPPPAGSLAAAEQPPATEARPTAEPLFQLPTSVERVRDQLDRQPVLRLDSRPVFRVSIEERRPRYWDLQSPFLFPVEPRTSTTRWHDEFLAMTTPDEVRMFSPMNSSADTAQLAATGLLFAGAVSLIQSGFEKWRDTRSDAKARAARAEVDAALAAWQAANPTLYARPRK